MKILKQTPTKLIVKNSVLFIIAFLLGRVRLFNEIRPFCVPFFVSGFAGRRQLPIIAAALIAGVISSGYTAGIFELLVLFCVLYIFIYRLNIKMSVLNVSIVSFLTVIAVGLLTAFLRGALVYDVLIAVLEAFMVAISVWAFKNTASVMGKNNEDITLSNEDFVCAIISLTATICGLQGVKLFDMDLTNIMSVLLILIFSYEYGTAIGTVCGALVGLLCSAVLPISPLIIGSYSICGLLAGLFGYYGKIGSSMGFVIGNCFLTMYLNGSVEALIILKEIVAALLLFGVVSGKVLQAEINAAVRMPVKFVNKKSYSERVKEVILSKMRKISAAFNGLADSTNRICRTQDVANINDITFAFDTAIDKICRHCSLCLVCWERNFYNTNQIIVKAACKLEDKGYLGVQDIPQYFRTDCIRIDELVNALNNSYDVYKTELLWKTKMQDTMRIICRQFENTAEIISRAASESDYNISFMNGVEDMIVNRLRRKGISVKDVVAYMDADNRFNTVVYHRTKDPNMLSTVKKVIYETTGRKMTEDPCIYNPDSNDGFNALRFVEIERYGIAVGTARAIKTGNEVSGDNFVFRNLENGRFLAALSDGVGSGMQASIKSECTVDVLEQLMTSGFRGNVAVDIIDSLFMTHFAENMSATVDVAIVDLYTAQIDFIKRGAVPSFLIDTCGIKAIEANSLPIGLPDSNVYTEKQFLHDGGFIILMTDGVYDIGIGRYADSVSFPEFLDYKGQLNPKKIANDIMARTIQKCDGTPKDDMLVVVIKVWKRV